MNGYHERSLDDPRPPAEDRPVAGWPAEETDQGEHRAADSGEEEPLVGEVWDKDASAEPAGTATGREGEPVASEETADATAEDEAGRGRYGEPFGTEEPIIIADSTTEEETAGATGHAETASEGAEPTATGAAPTAADELTVDRLIDADAAERFRTRWREVKGDFVDDPADAVRQASALSRETVDELTAALGRLRERLDGHWGEGEESDTERLRVALRGYGSLIERVLGH
ncbi:hypothetical protein [Actinoallomurus iriomotensis]|uniref:Uncharacterized protein n=1 Tax=Actinoallomurus iriomotensis TaxID=478107 RepID=A0A9W6S0K5_9ACTN|nr:hypothetical protein [Actinoallomurus iriomotensis]GLY84988.1 hypothetical protein Airi02_029170 [Actinoallomurus iriomotensis]